MDRARWRCASIFGVRHKTISPGGRPGGGDSALRLLRERKARATQARAACGDSRTGAARTRATDSEALHSNTQFCTCMEHCPCGQPGCYCEDSAVACGWDDVRTESGEQAGGSVAG